MADSVKKAIYEEFQSQGLYLDKEALGTLTEYVTSVGGSHEVISQLLEARDFDDSTKVTKRVATELVNKLCGGGQDVDLIQIISAFKVPKVRFDPVRKAFYREESPSTLYGTAQDKRRVYMERLYLLQQRLARNPLFNKPVFGDLVGREERYVQLTDIKALLGVVGKRKTVLGFISQLEDGRYFIEDLSGSIPIDLSETKTAAGFYIENCIVAAEGQLQHNGEFKVSALGMPPNEPREDSLAAAKGLDFFGGEQLKAEDLVKALRWETQHEEDRIIFVSDIWLDHTSTLPRLDAILSGFESLEEVPSLFVLLGNFHSFSCSSASTDYAAVRDNFASLAVTIVQHTRIMEGSRFVFVPGPGDPGAASVLPRPPLPAALTAELREALPTAIFASNPCRLRYYSHQIVVFRDDLQKRMRRLCLRPPVEGQDSRRADLSAGDAMFEHLAMTVTQQSHLCPIPLDNQLDHALRVYPLPDALVLADSAPAADYKERKSGCACLNPGSMHASTFAAYKPSSRTSELCDVPEEEG